MKTVWKFPLAAVDFQSIPMPKGAQLLCVQTQKDEPMLWALVNPDAPKVARTIRMAGTGHALADEPIGFDPAVYIGTFQVMNGSLVFHVFDTREEISLEDARPDHR